MPYVEVSKRIEACLPEAVFAFIKQMERYPDFMPDVASVRVLAREERATITKWKTRIDGMPIEWIERDEFDDDHLTIYYRQIEGDLKKFEGRWRVETDGGAAAVSLTVDFELGIPMIAGLVNPILTKKIRENCDGMLTAIEKELHKSIDS